MLTIRREHMNYASVLRLLEMDRDISGVCRVELADATVRLPVRIAMLQMIFWEIYVKLDMEVTTKQLVITDVPFNAAICRELLQKAYVECFKESGDEEHFDRLKTALWDVFNNLDDFGSFELVEYVSGLNIVDFAEIAEHPKAKEILNTDIREELGPMTIKRNLMNTQKDFMDLIKNRDALETNNLYPFVSVNSLKPSQLLQMFDAYGLRSEINDRVFRRPVYGNSLNGLKDMMDVVFENGAARKNVYYMYDAIKLSQYFNRKLALAIMVLRNLYSQWCGHDVQLEFSFEEGYVRSCFGKYFYLMDDPTRTVHILTEKNYKKYIDIPVMMYSAITCGHTDGVCHKCMSLIARNHTSGANVGMVASSSFAAEVSQLVLSTKHEDSSVPVVYQITKNMESWFVMSEEGIKMNLESIEDIEDMEVGIFSSDISYSIGDLKYISSDIDVPEHKYSSISSIVLKNRKTGHVDEIVTKQAEIIPFLTTEFIMYIKRHLDNGVHMDQDVFWVPLANIRKSNIPVMRTIIFNNSMMDYVNNITNIFYKKRNLAKYKNASHALKDILLKLSEKVQSINIYQVELIIKAHLITGENNYSIPVVDDPTNVIFDTTDNIINKRTISGQLAHEGHNKHFNQISTYTLLKDQNPMDAFVGI